MATAATATTAALLSACSEPVYLGSDVIWQARHEGGQLDEWQEGSRGGALSEGAQVTSAQARHGRFALQLLNPGDTRDDGPCVSRRFDDVPEAYYSAWYLVPEAPTTLSAWTLLRLQSLPLDAGDGGQGGAPSVEGTAGASLGGAENSAGGNDSWRSVIDLAARSVADGSVVLYLFDHSRAHLQLPLAVPPAVLPMERWFHLEVFYRTSPAPEGGELVVWLDGKVVYGVRDRPLGDGANVAFNLCNAGQATTPVEVFVDDAVVSRVRATPGGALSR